MTAFALKAFAPFAGLSEAERAELADLLEERHLSPEETLFAEGDDADALVLVLEGTLRLTSRRSREAAQLGSGSVLGGFSLFAVGARETTAVGADRAQVLLLRRADFVRLTEDSPRTACRVATALAAELAAHARQGLALLTTGSVDRAQGDE